MSYDTYMFQEFIEILILSAVQGISEFLPVSSSAHLILISTFSYSNDNKDSKETTAISDQLKILQDLYKSGAISGYEYEKEKKKILKK